MNANRLTTKSQEAFADAQSAAARYSNQTVDEQHLLYALLKQEGGLIPELMQSLGCDPAMLTRSVEGAIEKLPRVQTSTRQDGIYVSSEMNAALSEAESQAERMGDSYVSVEHLLLGMIECPNGELKEIFKTFGITKEKVLSALQQIRGNQQVTSQDPEDTYNVLKKYGQDLVEMAKKSKLDPVIGRD
ncbi:MAG: type VI secretion system ATPase TssH, partial [Ruminococcus sp.]|nr:type VI secretion system ATPase TssH [Ruminococcus sp.]